MKNKLDFYNIRNFAQDFINIAGISDQLNTQVLLDSGTVNIRRKNEPGLVCIWNGLNDKESYKFTFFFNGYGYTIHKYKDCEADIYKYKDCCEPLSESSKKITALEFTLAWYELYHTYLDLLQ